MAFGWFLRRFCRWGGEGIPVERGFEEGLCEFSVAGGMKVGNRLTPGGLGLPVNESVLIPITSGKPHNISGQGSGLIKLESI